MSTICPFINSKEIQINSMWDVGLPLRNMGWYHEFIFLRNSHAFDL